VFFEMVRQQVSSARVVSFFWAALVFAGAAKAEVDFSGQWSPRYHEDWQERLPGPDIGDYTGLPINDSARAKADAWEESVITLPERQCIPHASTYNLHGPSAMRIWPETDPISGKVVAWKLFGPFGMNYTVWMDGRPHPSEFAAHTWEGFTTGKWQGDTLTTYTDHVKYAYLRRVGIPHSDQATMAQHWMRHGDTLTITVIVYDPVYLTEPYIRTANWQLDPEQPNTLPVHCEVVVEIPRPRGAVPHILPGANPDLDELTKKFNIPFEAVRGGAETMYPEYRKKLKDKYVAPAKCERFCCGWIAPLPNGIPPGLNCNQYGFVSTNPQ
jgi:hypothetical protein